VPATIVNWGGDEAVSIEEWCTYLGELAGLQPRFEPTDATIESVSVDLSKKHELAGNTRVHWKDALRQMVGDGT
jgi:UDP-glucuronate 4-epimerase